MSSAPNQGLAGEVRNLSATLHEMKGEAGQFVQTRLTMLKSEMQEKLPNLKTAAILGIVGALLLITGYALLTLALVAVVVVLLRDNDYRWVIAFGGVGVLWALFGGVAAYFAKREFAVKGVVPKRTFEVLKGDKIWIEREAKNQI